MKITTQRLGVFLIVERAQDHPSALDVYKRIKSRHPTTSHDTVYRTLDTFAEWGLIDKVEYLDAKIRFDPNVKPHHHFICTECGSIRALWSGDNLKQGMPR